MKRILTIIAGVLDVAALIFAVLAGMSLYASVLAVNDLSAATAPALAVFALLALAEAVIPFCIAAAVHRVVQRL